MRAYRINRYLHQLVAPAFRERLLADPASTCEEAALTPDERDMITRPDWRKDWRRGRGSNNGTFGALQ